MKLTMIIVTGVIVGSLSLAVVDRYKHTYNSDVVADAPQPNKEIEKAEPGTFIPGDFNAIASFKRDAAILAEVIFFEQRGELFLRLPVDVVFNRVNSVNFANTIEEVVNQPYAFSYLNEGTITADKVMRRKIMQLPENKRSRIKAERVANLMLKDFIDGKWKDSTKGSIYYLNKSKLKIVPDWVDDSCMTIKEGSHTFYSCHKNA